jgi:4-amino-4-deoxy-L-arabinose transferase-like glycosyltransferase
MPARTAGGLLLIAVTVTLNALALFFPAIYSDAATYALISKNMALSGDWVNLMFMGQDWLDKPHFPFWITALSFTLFGVNAPAYLLPGLLFHALGAWFTYRLASHFYNRETGLLAALIALTSMRLLWSTVDVRAEAYLVAQITGALYFWVMYDEQSKPRHLLGGAAFTAMALMTKGPFVLGAIGGGLLCDLLRRRDWRGLAGVKWMLAAALSFVFILPELIALYLQFDRHPEKVVFGRTAVSGIRFFFWDSQFGRLMNTGPITASGGDPLFFVHTFLWAFLPWTFLFVGALAVFLSRRNQMPDSEVRPFVVLSTSLFIPLLLFSASRFQLDHYLDIVLPFAAILSAHFFLQQLPKLAAARWICRLQVWIALLLAIVTAALCLVVFRDSGYIWLTALPAVLLGFAAMRRAAPALSNGLILPVLAANVVFVILVLANQVYFERYDAAYKLARILDTQPELVVYDYGTASKTLAFYARQPYVNVENLAQVKACEGDCFIVANTSQLTDVMKAFPGAHVIAHASGTPSNRLSARMLKANAGDANVETTRLDLIRTGRSAHPVESPSVSPRPSSSRQ